MIREERLGPNHQDLSRPLNELGTLLLERGEYLQAESLFRRSVEIQEKSDTPNRLELARSHQHLGAVFQQQDAYAPSFAPKTTA